MERKKYFITLFIILLIFGISVQHVYTQKNYNSRIYAAYVEGSMTKWMAIMSEFEKNEKNLSPEQKFDLINYYYGYTPWLIEREKGDLADHYIAQADSLLDGILLENPRNATAYAYKGAFLAYVIFKSNMKAIYLGRESTGYIKKALELEPDNIQALVERGNTLLYSPSLFGGDKKEAIRYYKKASRIMEKKELTHENWVYLNVLTMTAQAYEKIGDDEKAKLQFEKILSIQPDFMWVRDEQYPDLLKRMNK